MNTDWRHAISKRFADEEAWLRDHNIRLARVALVDAREAKNRSQAFALLALAAERRLLAWRHHWTATPRAKSMPGQFAPGQLDLFAA